MRSRIQYIPILGLLYHLGEYILNCIEQKKYRRLWRDLCEVAVIGNMILLAIAIIIANSPSYKNNPSSLRQKPFNELTIPLESTK